MITRTVLTEDTLKAIREDDGLKEKIATVLRISVHSMPRLLYGNDPKLTQIDVLKIISDHLSVNTNSLVAEIAMV